MRSGAIHRRRNCTSGGIYSETRGRIVDFLGSHQHLAVDIDLSVGKEGGPCLRSGAQRFYEGPLAFNFPMAFSGVASVREWYDEKAQRFRISVEVHNKRWGPLFGYRVSFDAEWQTVEPGAVPHHVLPRPVERRE